MWKLNFLKLLNYIALSSRSVIFTQHVKAINFTITINKKQFFFRTKILRSLFSNLLPPSFPQSYPRPVQDYDPGSLFSFTHPFCSSFQCPCLDKLLSTFLCYPLPNCKIVIVKENRSSSRNLFEKRNVLEKF